MIYLISQLNSFINWLENELTLADKEKERAAKENPLQFDRVYGYATGIANALAEFRAKLKCYAYPLICEHAEIVQSNDNWILCTNRMPNNEYEDLLKITNDAAFPAIVTAKSADNTFYVTTAWYIELFLERKFVNADLEPLDVLVLAWQPLPKPCNIVK